MILLDTHVWVYLVTGMDLSSEAQKAINETDELGISAISCWEVAMLTQKGRLVLDREVKSWILDALKYPGLQVIELTPAILVHSVLLSDFHKDPADRMIVATCYLNHWTLITKDKRIQKYKLIKTIW